MANFQQAPGKVYPGFDEAQNLFKVPLGNETWKGPIFRDLALWGAGEDGAPLSPALDDPDLATFGELPSSEEGTRVFRFYAQQSGETLLHAWTDDGQDFTQPLQVVVTEAEAVSEKLPYFDGGDRQTTAQAIVDECRNQGLTLPTQLAYILGTCQHESNFQPVRESWMLTQQERSSHETAEAARQSKLSYYPFYGRGYIQLTHEKAYTQFGQLLDVGLHDDPDLALQPNIAVFVVAYGMANSQFGQPLTRYVNETQTDFIGARNSVNGGEGQANREKIAGYAEAWLADPLLAT